MLGFHFTRLDNEHVWPGCTGVVHGHPQIGPRYDHPVGSDISMVQEEKCVVDKFQTYRPHRYYGCPSPATSSVYLDVVTCLKGQHGKTKIIYSIRPELSYFELRTLVSKGECGTNEL